MFGLCMRREIRLGAYGTGVPMSLEQHSQFLAGGDDMLAMIQEVRDERKFIPSSPQLHFNDAAAFLVISELEACSPLLMDMDLEDERQRDQLHDGQVTLFAFGHKPRHLRIKKHIRRLIKKLCH